MRYILCFSCLFYFMNLNAQISLQTHPSLLPINIKTTVLPSVAIKTASLPESKTFAPSLTSFQFTNVGKQANDCAYDYNDLAFFCKIEVKLEKALKLPVKFRLGSVQYVDYLEGKNNYGDYTPKKVSSQE